MEATKIEPEYMSLENAAVWLGMEDERSLKRRAYRGKLPGAVKICGKWFIRIASLRHKLATGGF